MASKESLPTSSGSTSVDLEDSDYDTQSLLNHDTRRSSNHKENRRNWTFLGVNVFMLLLNVGLLLMMGVSKAGEFMSSAKSTKEVLLPHNDWVAPAIELEVRAYDDKFGTHGPFRGKSRPELDEAWGEMMKNYTVRVPVPGWRNASGPENILAKFQDERGGIMATMSFLHNIHCIKTIRQYMLPEDYPDLVDKYTILPGEGIPEHIDHCLDILRQSELCHADMALMLFEYRKDEPLPVNIHHAKHVCANTDKLNKWLEENTVPPFGHILVNPWTGEPPFPIEGESFTLGNTQNTTLPKSD